MNLFETKKAFSSLFIFLIILASDVRYVGLHEAHHLVRSETQDEHPHSFSKDPRTSKLSSSLPLLIPSFA